MAQRLVRDPATGALINTGSSYEHASMIYYRNIAERLNSIDKSIEQLHGQQLEIKNLLQTLTRDSE